MIPVISPDQENHRVAQILKVLHLAQQDGMAQMQVRSRRVEARLDPQRTIHLGSLQQALAQIFLANDLRHPLAQIRQLFVDGHCDATGHAASLFL